MRNLKIMFMVMAIAIVMNFSGGTSALAGGFAKGEVTGAHYPPPPTCENGGKNHPATAKFDKSSLRIQKLQLLQQTILLQQLQTKLLINLQTKLLMNLQQQLQTKMQQQLQTKLLLKMMK